MISIILSLLGVGLAILGGVAFIAGIVYLYLLAQEFNH